ncbi:cell division protein PerM [Janibacter corallicola]|uniref:cell division protein PerM n=1 Tax=Janibacter corallicola TaxID=415212 RepID=UPI000A85E742|nr:DUF6350 family protein [Janibacter corallicola]
MEMLRSATRVDEGEDRGRLWWAAGAGAATAASGLLVTVLLLVLGMLAVPRATAGAGDAVGTGALTWLVLGGGRVDLGAGHLAMTPLLGTALLLLLAWFGARRGLPDDPDARLRGLWLGGYTGVGVLAALLGLMAPAGPAWLFLPVPVLVLPALALALAHGVSDVLPERVARVTDRVPAAFGRALRPGLEGVGVSMAAGSLLVLLAVLVNLDRVGHIQSTLEAGFFGGLLLVLAQLLLLPNLGVWALSFAAGPGFSAADGASTTWSGAESEVLPMLPVLAAQPQPGGLPWVTHLLVVVPLLIGAFVARRALRRVPRLATTSTKAGVAAAAVAVTAVGVALLDGVAGGSLGNARLSDLGAPAVRLAVVLLLELGIGAAVVLTRDWWRLRR